MLVFPVAVVVCSADADRRLGKEKMMLPDEVLLAEQTLGLPRLGMRDHFEKDIGAWDAEDPFHSGWFSRGGFLRISGSLSPATMSKSSKSWTSPQRLQTGSTAV